MRHLLGQANEMTDCRGDVSNFICDPANNVVINMPFVRLHPVPRKAGERTRKETYRCRTGNTRPTSPACAAARTAPPP
jgi:hypothetical protein